MTLTDTCKMQKDFCLSLFRSQSHSFKHKTSSIKSSNERCASYTKSNLTSLFEAARHQKTCACILLDAQVPHHALINIPIPTFFSAKPVNLYKRSTTHASFGERILSLTTTPRCMQKYTHLTVRLFSIFSAANLPDSF